MGPLEFGDIKKKVRDVLKTDSNSNIEAMSTFIKTLEDEYEHERKIAQQRQIMNNLYDAQTAEKLVKRKAEL